MNRAQEIYLKRKEQLDIDGERAKKKERERRLAEERKLIKQKLDKTKSGEAANPPKEVDDMFKGREPSDEEPKKRAKRRTRKAPSVDVTLEGEEVKEEG